MRCKGSRLLNGEKKAYEIFLYHRKTAHGGCLHGGLVQFFLSCWLINLNETALNQRFVM